MEQYESFLIGFSLQIKEAIQEYKNEQENNQMKDTKDTDE